MPRNRPTLAIDPGSGAARAPLHAWAGLHIASAHPVVLLPSYGEPGDLPNLTPLLAMALAQRGAAVLVHGIGTDPAQAATATVLQDLGVPGCANAAAVADRWARRQPAFVDLAVLDPDLARRRARPSTPARQRSLRQAARLVCPVLDARTLRVVPLDRNADANRLGRWAAQAGTDVLLLHGAFGEPVADARRRPRMAVWLAGRPQHALSLPAQAGPLVTWPILPRAHDASTTALYIQAVLGGEKPMPEPLAQQIALVQQALRRMAHPRPLALQA